LIWQYNKSEKTIPLFSGYFGGNASKSSEMIGPKFVSLPSTKIRFSNSSGTELHCRAEGNPEPVTTFKDDQNVKSDSFTLFHQ